MMTRLSLSQPRNALLLNIKTNTFLMVIFFYSMETLLKKMRGGVLWFQS